MAAAAMRVSYAGHDVPVPDSPDSTTLRVLRAVCVLSDQRPQVAMRDVAAALGWPFTTTVFHLVKLRAGGFITWDDRRAGTLRPLVRIVADSEPRR